MKIAPLDNWISGLQHPLVIAGPCSAESEEQVLNIAHQVENIPGVKIYRAGIWKPRTRPGSFEGVGEKGLSWLSRVKNETNLLVTTEVANAHHVELALKHDIDILWIGARTTVSPFAVQEIADALRGIDIPVMVKNPVNQDLALWIGALERFSKVGITKLAAIHRGFSSGEKTKYRNPPLWKIPIELKRQFPGLPLFCDPSHITGNRKLVSEICQKAMDVNMDGLMVETHTTPDQALSDAAQQVTPAMLKEITKNLSLRTEFSTHGEFEQDIEALRSRVDRIDKEILEALAERMTVISEIGKLKEKNNITPLQIHRMDELMSKRIQMGEALGLKESYIKDIYHSIHTESVKIQTEIMNSFKGKK